MLSIPIELEANQFDYDMILSKFGAPAIRVKQFDYSYLHDVKQFAYSL